MIAALVYLCLGWTVLVLLARRSGSDRSFLYLLGGAFTAHLVLAVGLYLLAGQADPTDPHRYLAFRLLASDASAHSETAERIVKIWRTGLDMPLGQNWKAISEFRYMLAVLYYLFGDHPLVITGLNCLLVIPIGLAAHYLARSMGRTASQARLVALVVCLWPAGFAWSSVALREFWTYGALFGMMALFVWAMDDRATGPKRPRFWLAATALFVIAFFVTLVRWYLGRVFIPVAGAAVLAGIVRKDRRRFLRRQLPRGLILYGVMTAAVALAGHFGLSNVIQSLTAPTADRQQSSSRPGDFLVRYLASVRSIVIPSWSYIHRVRGDSFPPITLSQVRPGPAPIPRSAYRPTGGPARPAGPAFPCLEAVQGGLWPTDARALATELYDHFVLRLLFFPYPWDPWPKTEGNLLITLAVVAQSVLWYALLPGLVFGAIVNLRRLKTASVLVFLWALVLGWALSYVVPNLGTLYRLRDMAFLPALLFLDLGVYRRAAGWLSFWRRPRDSGRTSKRAGEV